MTKSNYRQKCLTQKLNVCNVCGSRGELVVHHIDGDHDNATLENLIPLCGKCHAKVHTTVEHGGRIDELSSQLPDTSFRNTPSRGEKKKIRTEVPEDVHRALKMEAASYGMNLQELHAQVLIEYVREQNDE